MRPSSKKLREGGREGAREVNAWGSKTTWKRREG
jgi:hypothetical protein